VNLPTWTEKTTAHSRNEQTISHKYNEHWHSDAIVIKEGVMDGWASSDAACQAGGRSIPSPAARPTFSVEKWLFSVTPASGGKLLSTAIEIIKWVKKFAFAQAKVTPTSWGLGRRRRRHRKELFRQVCMKYRRKPREKKGWTLMNFFCGKITLLRWPDFGRIHCNKSGLW
jgi:hypothetical protein